MHVTAVLLAAGQSRRMGCSKQLLVLSDRPVIRWCIDGLLAGGLEDIIVILGPTGREVEDAIKGYDLNILWNKDPDSDMAGSLKIALNALPEQTTSVLVLPVDHPLVSPQTVRTMLSIHSEDPERIVIPVHRGRKGHPVILPRAVAGELFTFHTLREVVRRDSARLRLVTVEDEGVLVNLNTPGDLQEIKPMHRNYKS